MTIESDDGVGSTQSRPWPLEDPPASDACVTNEAPFVQLSEAGKSPWRIKDAFGNTTAQPVHRARRLIGCCVTLGTAKSEESRFGFDKAWPFFRDDVALRSPMARGSL